MAGCTKDADSPEAVAEKFWEAMMDRDIDEAKNYATKSSAYSLKENNNKSDSDVKITFGEVKTEKDNSSVETTMHSSQGGSEHNIPMKTFLIQENGEWKVEAQKTMMSMFGGAMSEIMEGLGDAMKDSMKEMGKAMAEGMKEGMKEGMQDNMEEMRKQFKENMEKP